MTAKRLCKKILAVLTFSVTTALAEPHWGAVKSGLQLGIDWRKDSTEQEPALQVFLRNASSERRTIPVGLLTGPGVYLVTITAVRNTPPSSMQVFDTEVLKMRVGGLPSPPMQVDLEPDAVYVMTFTQKQLLCFIDRRDTPIADVLKQGYALRARFQTVETPALSLHGK